MTHIVLVAGSYQPQHCGVANYTQRLRETIQPEIHTTVLTTHRSAQAVQDATVFGVVQDWSLPQLGRLVRAIHQSRADILHIQHAAGTYHFERAIFLLPLWLRLTGWQKPIVTTVHEYGWWEWQPRGIPPAWIEGLKQWGQRRAWWDREDGFLLTQSDALITTNALATQIIGDRLPALQPRLHEIPIAANIAVAPIDRAIARQQLRQKFGWPEQAIALVFFGFLHPVKGLETLFHAFQTVQTNYPEARLLVIGGVESLALPGEQASCYWQKLKDQIRELGLCDQVAMTGYLEAEATSYLLSGADIGVLPFNHGVTLKSGSLLALLSHALPVIATRSHPPDPALENVNILEWVQPRDSEELTQKLTQLLYDSERQKTQAIAGYQFSQQFLWQRIGDQHWQIYQRLGQHLDQHLENADKSRWNDGFVPVQRSHTPAPQNLLSCREDR